MKALCVAGGIPHVEMIRQLKARGITTVLVDGSDACLARHEADVFCRANVFDEAALEKIALREKVDFILTVCADQVLLVVASLSEKLGLPCYVSYDVCQRASEKREMKRMFRENGIPSSRYVETDAFAPEAFAGLRFPLVVKPVDAYSSKGVRKAENMAELETYFHEAAAISRTGGVITEEFCEGGELSVDAFVVNGKAQLLLVSASEKVRDRDRFVIFRNHYPSGVSAAVEQKILDICQRIADALELKNSPLLVQLIQNGEDVSVLEYCTRTGGSMKYLIIRYSSGVDVIRATIDITLGIEPDVTVTGPAAPMVTDVFVYCREGVLDRIEGQEMLLNEGTIVEFRQNRLAGNHFTGVRSSGDRACGMTVLAKDAADYNRKQARINEVLKVIDTEGRDIMRHDLLPDME